MAYLSTPKRSYQVCHGIRNPAENNYSWVVSSDHDTLEDARETYREMEKRGVKPLALLQVDTRIVEKVPALGELVDG